MAKKSLPQEKRRPGKPAFVPTDKDRMTVRIMAAYRIPEDVIVLAIPNPYSHEPISPVTLRKHFADELRSGFAWGKMRILAACFHSAVGIRKVDDKGNELQEWLLKPDTGANIWIQKTQYGLRETVDVLLPPSAEGQEKGGIVEAARRVAFALAKGAHLAQKP